MAQNPDLHLWRAVLVAGLPFLTRGGYAMGNAYGAALNEGRAQFPENPRGDAGFGQWIVDEQLVRLHADRDVFQAERAAAMWAVGREVGE